MTVITAESDRVEIELGIYRHIHISRGSLLGIPGGRSRQSFTERSERLQAACFHFPGQDSHYRYIYTYVLVLYGDLIMYLRLLPSHSGTRLHTW